MTMKKMEDIANLIVSKKNSGNRLIDKFFELFNKKEIIIAEINQINNFGVFYTCKFNRRV